MVGEYILLAVLLISAIFIVTAVTLQKSNDEGLSGTITGGSDSYYGKNKSAHTGRTLRKWIIITSIIFALAVVIVYIIQPDYVQSYSKTDYWQQLSEFSSIFAE